MDERTAVKVWEILVKHAGAREDGRADFIYQEGRGCVEYRFGGKLGFGGKFWGSGSRWYVTCYPEDESPKVKRIVAKVNRLLLKLKEESK